MDKRQSSTRSVAIPRTGRGDAFVICDSPECARCRALREDDEMRIVTVRDEDLGEIDPDWRHVSILLNKASDVAAAALPGEEGTTERAHRPDE